MKSRHLLFLIALLISSVFMAACHRGLYHFASFPEPEVRSYLDDEQDASQSWVNSSFFKSQATESHYDVISQEDINAAQPPRHIALLLPLRGALGASGRAIRNGFLAAYYQSKSARGQVPRLSVLDTSTENITTLYQKALSQGADFIVGPLSQSNLAQLVQEQAIKVPTLALNKVKSDVRSGRELFQFSLSPSDEVYQVVGKAWQTGYRNAAIIAPNTVWGRSIARVFSRQWLRLGGHLLAEVSYKDRTTLSADIKSLLNVDRSEGRKQALEKLLRKPVHFVPRRRHDIDVIFIAALPQQARQIRPLIKFHYAGSIPVYSISSIYKGVPLPRQDRDLDGIRFCEAPWILKAPDDLPESLRMIYQRIMSVWPNQYRHYPKLYMFGVDAYRLTGAIRLMQSNSNLAFEGATGMLSLGGNRIYRQLSWAKFEQGLASSIED